jgi:outer membrane protein assembly factor BamD (BamD/ComL family)
VQLDAERALLDAARVALVSGDTDTALRALDQHSRTFPRPMLGEERDALFVQALVRAGRYDQARARAEAFRRRNPQSLFLTAVDAAIASIP